ncbi:hypothetical protein GCM10010156_76530 [Planobispora rosea]|uniref:Uncharacterized protein n=1 Tax=Planobispora rosea TaxID=35762 RepID=A0A8J3WIR8_PLARO|nr:hypothetical protein [Planobispora rosea]GGT08145.1 hypothetical protein GCM10010156_76530 [Planobispora rosea]GIH89131.1 hypothetical protein Pro02_75390 [Planobispora rosea]
MTTTTDHGTVWVQAHRAISEALKSGDVAGLREIFTRLSGDHLTEAAEAGDISGLLRLGRVALAEIEAAQDRTGLEVYGLGERMVLGASIDHAQACERQAQVAEALVSELGSVLRDLVSKAQDAHTMARLASVALVELRTFRGDLAGPPAGPWRFLRLGRRSRGRTVGRWAQAQREIGQSFTAGDCARLAELADQLTTDQVTAAYVAGDHGELHRLALVGLAEARHYRNSAGEPVMGAAAYDSYIERIAYASRDRDLDGLAASAEWLAGYAREEATEAGDAGALARLASVALVELTLTPAALAAEVGAAS